MLSKGPPRVVSRDIFGDSPGRRRGAEVPDPMECCGAIMTRLFGQRAIERAAVILRVGQRYSGDELDGALKAARRAILCSLEEAGVDTSVGRSLVEALDAAVVNFGRSIQCVPSRITAALPPSAF